jgi:hypothetical protein
MVNSPAPPIEPPETPRKRPSIVQALVRSRLVQVGAALLVLGTGPLIGFIVLAPRSNPIGPGLLAFFTFWPSIGLIVAGVIAATVRTPSRR